MNSTQSWLAFLEENKINYLIKAASKTGVAFFLLTSLTALGASNTTPAPDVSAVTPTLKRTIHEAENLSLNRDRALACGVLWRNVKKANKADAKVLKEKLMQLSRYYYTDKGFQAFLVGKEFFQKQKYQDAIEKLLEADDLEAGNVEVLHYLTLSQLSFKKLDQAEATNKLALLVCPIDIELQRDLLALEIAQELWPEAKGTAETLGREYADFSAQTLQGLGVAFLKTEQPAEAKKALGQSLQKDNHLPETYYWLASAKDDKDSLKLLTKYVELCKNKATNAPAALPPGSEREIGFCTHLTEVEKKIGP